MNNRFYILCNSCTKNTVTNEIVNELYEWYVVPDAKPIIIDNVEFFLRYEINSLNQKSYHLTDSLSGLMVSWGWTEQEAVEKAKTLISNLFNYRKEHIEKHGLSPRYTKDYKYKISDNVAWRGLGAEKDPELDFI